MICLKSNAILRKYKYKFETRMAHSKDKLRKIRLVKRKKYLLQAVGQLDRKDISSCQIEVYESPVTI